MAKMWIQNEWVDSVSGASFPIDNPATEEIIDTVPRANAEDVDRAVTAAWNARKDWRFMPGIERAELMHHLARIIRRRRTELAETLTREGGKPLIENRDEVEWVAAVFDYYAEIGRDAGGRVIAPVQRRQINFITKEPYGVVACIVPWNYPLLLMAWKVAPALAAGNTIVLKPSEMTPLSTLQMVEAFKELPAGVLNIVTGFGAECGEPLVTHKRTEMVAFTGSIATGRQIARLAAERIKKVHLELGGNDPFIVCDDVDVDLAARAAVWAAFLNMGQVCTSGERFYVFRKVADRFIERFVETARSLRLGNPMGPDVDLGPMIRDSHREKIERLLREVTVQGAQVVAGGRRPGHLSTGYFFEPTVVLNVNHSMRLMCEETFGPIAPIMVVDGIEQAIALADDSDYGLGASILTNNLEYAMRAMENIKAGTFWINDPLTDNDAGPFGGMRRSGIGRELGLEGLEEFRDTKHVHLDYCFEAKPYWFPYRWDRGRKTE